MRLLHLAATGPLIVASTAMWVMATALLPSPVGSIVLLLAVAVVATLACGGLEKPAVRLLAGVRDPTAAELAAMTPVLARLARAVPEARVRDLYVRRLRAPAAPAIVLGRGSLVASHALIRGVALTELPVEESVALLAHAVGRHRARRQRCELALAVWTAPWSAVAMVVRGVGNAAATVPLLRPAWQLRAAVGVVCVAQSAAEGRTGAGVLGGGVVAATYLVPAARRAVERRVKGAADYFGVDRGLKPALVSLPRGTDTSFDGGSLAPTTTAAKRMMR